MHEAGIELHERRFTKFGGKVESEIHMQLKTGCVDNRMQEIRLSAV
jgi:hypothetical protein